VFYGRSENLTGLKGDAVKNFLEKKSRELHRPGTPESKEKSVNSTRGDELIDTENEALVISGQKRGKKKISGTFFWCHSANPG